MKTTYFSLTSRRDGITVVYRNGRRVDNYYFRSLTEEQEKDLMEIIERYHKKLEK